ncbi:NAD-dependent epimerase/dehydratase family protein [Ferrovibrio sp.]|uniref:NAD-dependent epimerase/dehydratase family protein n=1 Tax=Ferrovibrio sp. TaxID=1917215 RepID=UPI0035AF68D7
MRILLTGGSGFIGRSLAPKLAGRHEVLLTGRQSSARFGVDLIEWDLSQPAPPQLEKEKIDAIVHLAQSGDHRDFPASAPKMFAVNVAGGQNLLDFAAKAGVSQFCLVSTGTVYEPFTAKTLREDMALSPSSMLGATKLAAEVIAQPYSHLFKLCILRLFFPYGVGQVDRLLPNLVGRIASGQPIQVSKDGEGLRFTPIWLDDVVDVISTAVEQSWTGTMNVANPRVVTIRTVGQLIAEQIGTSLKVDVTAAEPLFIVPDLTRLQSYMDLSGMTGIESGIAAMLHKPLQAPAEI